MLPRALSILNSRLEGDRIVPRYFDGGDVPWLSALLDEHTRFVGRKCRELEERLRAPLPVRAPRAKLRIAAHVLEGLSRHRTTAALPPREARARLFFAAAAEARPRERVLTDVAEALGVSTPDLEAALFADLKGERRVAPLPLDVTPARLGLEANLEMVASLLRRAAWVRITARGNTRALVRHARRLGLICLLSRPPGELDRAGAPAPDSVVLELSGPFALFRHTGVYGRALASLVPRAAWCHEFELHAACALTRGSRLSTLIVRSGDPIAPGRELVAYDDKVEERFANAFRRAAPDWELVREPEPIDAADALVFPDFELRHRQHPERRWLVEIVGFWTREYLVKKWERLQAAGVRNLLLCIDETRRCSDAELPRHAWVLPYRRAIDPKAVLAAIADGVG